MKGANDVSKKTAAEIITATLETGETVLAKKDLTPLRYGNETQALAKIASIRPQLVEIGHRARVIKQGGDIYPGELTLIGQKTGRELPISEAITLSGVESISDLVGAKVRIKLPGFQNLFTKIVHKDLDARFKPRRSFATTSGKRMNPRSRHNHPTNTADERYYYVS